MDSGTILLTLSQEDTRCTATGKEAHSPQWQRTGLEPNVQLAVQILAGIKPNVVSNDFPYCNDLLTLSPTALKPAKWITASILQEVNTLRSAAPSAQSI